MASLPEVFTVTPNIVVDNVLGDNFAKLDLTASSLNKAVQTLELTPDEIGETIVHFSADQAAVPGEYQFGGYKRSTKTIKLYPLTSIRALDDLAQHFITHEPVSDMSSHINQNSSVWKSFKDASISEDLSKALLHELKHRHDDAKNFSNTDVHELINQEMWRRFFTLLGGCATWSTSVVASSLLLPNRWQTASAAVAITDLTVQTAKALFSRFKRDRYHKDPLEVRARDFEETYAADFADLIIAKLRA